METEWLEMLSDWFPSNPLFGVLITCLIYWLINQLYLRQRAAPWLHPVLWSIVLIILLLSVVKIDYEVYWSGGQILHFFLGPATVALAWPLYQNLNTIRKLWLPVLVSVSSGVLVGATSVIYLAQVLGASELTQLSLAPKSVTTPVAIAVVEQLGGLTALTAGFVIITGVVGAMFGAMIFKALGIVDQRVKGIAMGVSAHGVGTARAWQIDHTMGAFSGLAMALSAFLVAFILPPWLGILGIL